MSAGARRSALLHFLDFGIDDVVVLGVGRSGTAVGLLGARAFVAKSRMDGELLAAIRGGNAARAKELYARIADDPAAPGSTRSVSMVAASGTPMPVSALAAMVSAVSSAVVNASSGMRVSRVAANIPLIRHNLSPLSFVDVPQQAYIDGMLGVYELNRVDLLRDVFVWAYERSCQQYVAVRQQLVPPDTLYGMLALRSACSKGRDWWLAR